MCLRLQKVKCHQSCWLSSASSSGVRPCEPSHAAQAPRLTFPVRLCCGPCRCQGRAFADTCLLLSRLSPSSFLRLLSKPCDCFLLTVTEWMKRVLSTLPKPPSENGSDTMSKAGEGPLGPAGHCKRPRHQRESGLGAQGHARANPSSTSPTHSL